MLSLESATVVRKQYLLSPRYYPVNLLNHARMVLYH